MPYPIDERRRLMLSAIQVLGLDYVRSQYVRAMDDPDLVDQQRRADGQLEEAAREFVAGLDRNGAESSRVGRV